MNAVAWIETSLAVNEWRGPMAVEMTLNRNQLLWGIISID